MPDLSFLAGTTWYVPPQNLLAYLCDPALRNERAVADQTVWSIASASGNRFEGTSVTQLWTSAPDGVTELGSTTNTMSGSIAADGAITIVFTPSDPDQAETTGYGQLRRVEGAWRMEMQMATGTSLLAVHWAYMTRLRDGEAVPGPPAPLPDPGLRSVEWRWLEGTSWSAVDEELFPGGASFTLSSYRNGYFWGDGSTSTGDSLRVGGSVTPEGTLYLLFSVSGQPAAARRGEMATGDEARRMSWTLATGGAEIGTAAERFTAEATA